MADISELPPRMRMTLVVRAQEIAKKINDFLNWLPPRMIGLGKKIDPEDDVMSRCPPLQALPEQAQKHLQKTWIQKYSACFDKLASLLSQSDGAAPLPLPTFGLEVALNATIDHAAASAQSPPPLSSDLPVTSHDNDYEAARLFLLGEGKLLFLADPEEDMPDPRTWYHEQ